MVMRPVSFKLHVSDSIGKISCELIEAAIPQAAMALAHGAGAGMHHQFMVSLAHALGENGITTLRYQFPYMENNKKRPDPPAVAQKAIAAVANEVLRRFANLPVYAGGKSFGGRMTSLFATSSHAYGLKGLIFYGFPLHPAGKPAVDRAEHLRKIPFPMLFLQGTRDKLADPELITDVTQPLSNATLVSLDGADHSFHMLKSSGFSDTEMIDKLAILTADWMKKLKHQQELVENQEV